MPTTPSIQETNRAYSTLYSTARGSCPRGQNGLENQKWINSCSLPESNKAITVPKTDNGESMEQQSILSRKRLVIVAESRVDRASAKLPGYSVRRSIVRTIRTLVASAGTCTRTFADMTACTARRVRNTSSAHEQQVFRRRYERRRSPKPKLH